MTRSRGFKLLEVMVAGAIFFTVAILFLNLLPASFWATKKADNRMDAHALASSKLEELRSGSFPDLAVGVSAPETVERNGTSYQITYEVGQVGTRSTDLLKGVKVTVNWNERTGSKSAVVESYLSVVRR